MTKAVLLAVVVTASIAMPRAQTPTASPAFEVASIRQNRDGSVPQKFDWQHGGRVTVTAYPLFQLIRIAYNSNSIQTEGQIVGGPSWLKSDRFDLVAKANGSLDADETGRPTLLIAMLRSLLEDRFHVRVHTELRDALVYFLALANKDGRLGPQLHRSAQEDCRGPVGTLVPPDSTHWCGWRGGGTGRYTIQGLTMADMATGFAGTWTVGRPVLDRTADRLRAHVLARTQRGFRTDSESRRRLRSEHAVGHARSTRVEAGGRQGQGRISRHRSRGTADARLAAITSALRPGRRTE
jgi:uncharacterized protein (TIGR03435 family)